MFVLSLQTLLCDSQPTFTGLFEQFTNLTLDKSKVFYVRDFFISREQAAITLDSGTVYFSKPVMGRYCVAVFSGTGTFSFTPPVKVEQDQLEKFFKVRKMYNQFKTAFFIFGDSTLYDIEKASTVSTAEPTSDAKESHKLSIKYLTDAHRTEIDNAVAKVLLDQKFNETLFSYLDLDGKDPVILRCDPNLPEEIQLKRAYGVIGNNYVSDVICQFGIGENNGCPENPKEEIDITKYKIKCKILNSLDINCESEVYFKAIKDNFQWLYFDLSDKLKVDSIVDNRGNKLHFNKGLESYDVCVRLNERMKINDSTMIKFYYNGRYIRRILDFVFLESSMGWYPGYGYLEKSIFDLTFIYPDNYKFSSIGDNISNETKDEFIYSRWVTNFACRNASFNLGPYRVKNVKKDNSIAINLFYVNNDYIDNVTGDVEESLKFYNQIYGEYPYNHFNITELPEYHGEAFPGMLHLSSATFKGYLGEDVAKGFNEAFVSHEVAHQWWGINVDFLSYRDRWLSEGIADYSSLMYVQRRLDNDRFFKMLEDYKKELLAIRTSFLGKGMEAGAISLGHRNETFSTRGDYNQIVYKKGAWVLHMLRNILVDLKTMKEDVFYSVMKEFYQSHAGKSASTCDFRRLVESKTGMDMGWFFDEWVDGSKIPTYVFAYKIDKKTDGKYNVRVRIKQKDVPPDFKMFVPMLVDFGDKKYYRLRTFMTGDKAEFDLPPMPLEPQKVIFNDLESVLCNVDTESWD